MEAAALLDAAGGHVKTALVMGRLGVERGEAERRIAEEGGRLGALLGAAQ
jgi:N-acetylmuramic acid 6-phosphate etherase